LPDGVQKMGMVFFSKPESCRNVPEPCRNDLNYSAAVFKKGSIPRTESMMGSFLLCRDHAAMVIQQKKKEIIGLLGKISNIYDFYRDSFHILKGEMPERRKQQVPGNLSLFSCLDCRVSGGGSHVDG